MTLTIKERTTGEIIATGKENESAREFEGNWYFNPNVVNMDTLRVTERTYTCPYKGVCYWIDMETADGERATNVGWVYRNPKPGYEFIKDEIGFYARPTQLTVVERINDQPSHATASLAK
jgi:uncharacterized protein (DUF427 family)